MSSSFVKDCSDVSAGRNTNYIIIVDSDTGNVALDGDSIQNLLANQVSVLHLGGADVHENYNEESAENSTNLPVSTDGATHVNVTLEGFSSIPIGGDGSSGNYAELPLDADAFQRLESVLESEEAREILGEPLLNMVTDPDNLGSLDQLLDPNILAGDSLNESVNDGESSTKKGSEASFSNSTKEARQSPPMRRSQRQQDKATKEEVEKILAENQRQFKEEKAKMKQNNISTQKNEQAEEKKNEIEIEGIEENTESQEDGPTTRYACGHGRGDDKKTEVVAAFAMAIPRGRGRIRGRIRNIVLEKETEADPTVRKVRGLEGRKNNAEMKEIEKEPIVARGRLRGRNKIDKGKEEGPTIYEWPSRDRGVDKREEVLPANEHKGRGKGRGRFDSADILNKPGDTKMKNLEVTVEKIDVVEAKDISAKYERGEEKICEKNILLTSQTLPEDSSTNSSQDMKKDAKLYLNQSERANNINNLETFKENEEAKHLKVLKEEIDNIGSKIDHIEDKEQKKGSISSGKENENDMVEEKLSKNIDKKNIIENKKILQTFKEDSVKDTSKVEYISKQNYQPSTRSKVIQVKNVTEVKQVVMLNSVTSLRSERGAHTEPLVKIVSPKDLPSEEKSDNGTKKPAKGIVQCTVKAPLTPKKESRKRATTTMKAQTTPMSVDVVNPIVEESTSTVRRSGRAIKKKTFGDEMVTFDDKEDDVIDEDDEAAFKDSEEESTDEEDDEDPERLWCICQKPHNNRFMICCDKCEDWFHGSCVGITKAMGQQMENESQEWVCPKCKKAERALKGQSSSPIKTFSTETSPGKSKEGEKIEVKSTDVKAYIIEKSEVKEKKEENTSSALTSNTPGKSEPRVLVYEKMTGKVLTGNMAPTLGHLKIWLKEHPEYAVLQPGMMGKTVSSVSKTGCGVTPIKTMDGAVSKTTIMKVSPTGPSQVKATVTSFPAVSNPTSTNTINTADTDSTALVSQQFHSQKKVVQLSMQTVPEATIQDVKKNNVIKSGDSTIIVNSADGKVTVKTGPPEPKKKVQKNFIAALNATTPSKQMAVENFYRNSNAINTQKNKTVETVQESTSDNTASKNEFSQDSTAIKTSLKKEDPAIKKSDEKEIKKVTSQIKQKAPSILPKSSKADPNEIRNNIRKSLADCLFKRFSQAKKELLNVNEETIAELAKEIELQLYNTFSKDVGFKYKSRYRSLVFNINDAKNSGLFRKILKGDLKPERLAKMTSEELASKELAQWREMEEKKELKAIEKHELDMISLGNQYIMKSHKGEIEIDKDQYIRDRETAPETLNTLPQETPDVPEDSSNNHRNHVYDPNCKICTENKPIIKDVMSEKEKQKKEKGNFDGKQRDNKEKRNSEKERETHTKDKERDREKYKDREKDRERSKEKDKTKKAKSDGSDKSKSSDKHRSHKNTEREKSKHRYPNEKDYERVKERDRKHSEKHKDRRDSKDERKELKDEKRETKDYKDSKEKYMSRDERKDSKDRHELKDERKDSRTEKKDSKDCRKEEKEQKRRDSLHDSDWKRKHSESRSEDCKRHNSEKDKVRYDCDQDSRNDFERRTDTDMKDTTVVSTSEDVVKVPVQTTGYSRQTCPSELEVQVPETSSTVIGSPELLEECFTPPYETGASSRSQSPTFFSERPETPPTPSIAFPTSPGSPLDGSSSPPLQSYQESSTPPLPNFNIATPPLPEAKDFRHTSLTPPLHQEVTTPPLPQCAPATPPPPPSFPDDSDRLTPPPAKGAPQIVWKGSINQDMVAKFDAFAFAVSGKADFLTEDVPKGIEVCGRISPEMVWMYIAQMKKSGSKEILVVRFQPANEDEKLAYIALYSHLSKKKRYAVIGNCQKTVKDFYVVPLASHQPIPQVLLPLDGPGFEEQRAHMLIGVIVRSKKEIERSYTPPLRLEDNIIKDVSDEERSYTPPPDHLPLPSGPLKRPARDSHPDQPSYAKIPHLQGSVLEGAAFSEDTGSPHEEGSKESCVDQEKMLAELNRQIEEQKKELNEMTNTIECKNSKGGSNSADGPRLDSLAKINIPSNLQAILDSINLKEQAIKKKEQEIQRRKSTLTTDSTQGDVDLRPLLMQSESYCKKDVDLRILNDDPHMVSIVKDDKEIDTDLRMRDPRLEKQEAGLSIHQPIIGSQAQMMGPGVSMTAHPSHPSTYPQSQYMDIPQQGPHGSIYHGNRPPGPQVAPVSGPLGAMQGSHDLPAGPHGPPHGPKSNQQGYSQGNHSAHPGTLNQHLGPHGSSGGPGTHCPAGIPPDTRGILGPLRPSEIGSHGPGFGNTEIHRNHHGPMHGGRGEGWSEDGFHPDSSWEGGHTDGGWDGGHCDGSWEGRHGWRGGRGSYRRDRDDQYDHGGRHFSRVRGHLEKSKHFERDQFYRGNGRGEAFFREHHIRDQHHGRDKHHSDRSHPRDRGDQWHYKHDRERDFKNERDRNRRGRGREYPLHRKDHQQRSHRMDSQKEYQEDEEINEIDY